MTPTIPALIARLGQDFDAIANTALARAAEGLATQIRAALSTAPGGPHDHPWLRTGALHDSIETQSEGATAIVASTSSVALYQETGTAEIPPRPTFAPVAANEGAAIAHQIGLATAQALRGP